MFLVRKIKVNNATSQTGDKIFVGMETYGLPSIVSAGVMSVSRQFFHATTPITFHFNNGEANRTIDYTIGSQYRGFPIETVPVEGMKIGNWYFTSDFSGNPVRKDGIVDGTVTDLYAKWTSALGEEYAEFAVSTQSPNTTISIQYLTKASGANDIYVDWGDGTHTSLLDSVSALTHEYTAASAYSLKVSDTVAGFGIGLNTTTSCEWLTEVVSWGNITGISSYGFYKSTSLSAIPPFNAGMRIGMRTFAGCEALSSVTIPDGIGMISTYVFSNTGITTLSVPDSYTGNMTGWMQGCTSLSSAVVGSGVTTTARTFSGCSNLVSVEMRCSPSVLGTYCFASCASLPEFTIPDGVQTIATYAFQDCTGLSSLTFPPELTTIQAKAFNGTTSCLLFDFSRCSRVPSLGNTSAFDNTSSQKKIVVPDSLYSSWVAANNWSSSTNGIVDAIVSNSNFINSQ